MLKAGQLARVNNRELMLVVQRKEAIDGQMETMEAPASTMYCIHHGREPVG
jgi:hypothetical protein